VSARCRAASWLSLAVKYRDHGIQELNMNRPPLPPFTAETAAQKVRMAEDAWNTRDPAKVVLAYSV
jgi:hypothetical protein